MRDPQNAQEAEATEAEEAEWQEAEAARAEAEAQQQEAKHTPGPWTPCTTSRGAVGVRAGMGAIIATTLKADAWDVSMEKPEAKANAVLMAAAPKMLDGLKEIDEYLTRDEDDGVSNFIGTRSELHQHVRHLIDLATDRL